MIATGTKKTNKVLVRFIFTTLVLSLFATSIFAQKKDSKNVTRQSVDSIIESLGTGVQTFEYTNPDKITINDNSTATEYPSEITVAGLNPESIEGIIIKINGLTHTHPDDIDMILEAPDGTRSVLMSDAGGVTDVENVTFIFFADPTAPFIPDNAELTGPIYDVANYDAGTPDNYPSPGPGNITGGANLNNFDDIDPNGTWKLFVVDDTGGDVGEIAEGWSMFISVEKVTLIVDQVEDGGGFCLVGGCSLRAAMHSKSANTIVFDPLFETPQTIVFDSSSFDGGLTGDESKKIIGPGSDKLTIMTDSNDNDSVIEVFLNRSFEISGIKITGGFANRGGGINSHGYLKLDDVTIIGNEATTEGGGIYHVGRTLSISNSVIDGNGSGDDGGGIYNRNGRVFIDGSSISENFALDDGGGIFNDQNTMSIINSTISSNEVEHIGGGIANAFRGTVNLTHVTVSDNVAANAGGIWSSSISNLSFGNTIVANNSSPFLPDLNSFGPINSRGYNLVETEFGGFVGDTTGNITGQDPMLSPLGFYGGKTRSHMPQTGSPVIDAGNSLGINDDQTGRSRPKNDPSMPNVSDGADIGAVERQTFENTQTFENSNRIRITNEFGDNTPASVYPATINIASLGAVSINKVTVTLSDLSHTFPEDIDILVQAPNGMFSYVMSDAGGGGDVNGIDLTFDQDAAQTIPTATTLTSGTFKPANHAPNDDVFPAPGPGVNDTIVANLSIFNGIDPNGEWKLFVVDGADQDIGEIAGGWSLNFELSGNCNNSLSSNSIDITAAGGSGNFNIIASPQCSWTASAPDDWIEITSPTSGTGNANIGFTVERNINNTRSGTITVGGQSHTVNQAAANSTPTNTTKFDFDGDGKTDVSIYRPSLGQWWRLFSSDLSNRGDSFGVATDELVPADFTGDGKTDIALFRPSTSEWIVLRSEDFSFFSFPFGTSGDIPAPGDFDGDGMADATVYRPSTGFWFTNRSSDGGLTSTSFGIAEDKPVVADYDGDGMDDIAVFRPSLSQWFLNRSTDGFIGATFGASGDKTVQGDWTGDGKADIALFRPSTNEWIVLRSEDFSFFAFPFGTAGDIPSPGDYDGDGMFDATVFRPSTSFWFKQQSTNGFEAVPFGQTGDIPVPNVYVVE